MKIIQKSILMLFLSFSFSQTLQEVERLKNEYTKVLNKQSLQKPPEIQEAENRAKSTALPDKLIYTRKDVESLLVNTQKLLEELEFIKDSSANMKYIGYEFFTERDTLPFWQNLPIPKDYTLGPGDEVVISLWGEVNLFVNKTINREGQIYVENVGPLYLSDKTLNDAKEYVFRRFSKIYSTLSNQNPKTYIDLSIGDLKSLNVHFVGNVNLPGIHMVHPFSTVLSSLGQAGGVSNRGSLREIHLIRNSELIAKIDLYDYIFFGDSKSDLRLLDQDVIYVPPRNSTIAITGYISNPGYFESIEGENLGQIINISGGLNYKSNKNIFVFRRKFSNNESFIVTEDNFDRFLVHDGDSISITNNLEIINDIEIGGQIRNPGVYPYYKGMRLNALIEYTQSKQDSNFFKTIDLNNITINRRNSGSNEPLIIKTNSQENLILKNKDVINFGVNKFYKPLKKIKITGEVQNPGLHVIKENSTLEEVLEIAGGLTENSIENGIEIFRDSVKIRWKEKKFIIMHNDSLNVLKKSGLVLVNGEVNEPGYVTFNKKNSVKKYINLSGGFSPFADESSVYIIYPNGISKPLRKWRAPKVVEGSTIIINERLISSQNNRLSGWAAFTALSSQAGNIITTLLSIALIANQVNAN